MRHLKNKQITINSTRFSVDRILMFLVIGLVFFGLIMVYDSSSVAASRDFGDNLYYFRNQLLWAVGGLVLFFLMTAYDYHKLIKLAPLLFLINIVALVVVLIPGIGTSALGARRWLYIVGFGLQPAEAAKLATVLFLSYLLPKNNKLIYFSIVIAIIGALMMGEPDLGTTVVTLSSALIVYFLSGVSLKNFLIIIPAFLVTGLILIFISPYRRSRLTTFLNHKQDQLGSAYHVRQALIAVGSGGIGGVGLGQSRQKYLFLPEVTTDSIFAIISEEFGFIGGITIISCFIIILLRGFQIAYRAPDIPGQLLGAGIVSVIVSQALINLAAMVSLVPLTGIPLPLVSYGGSSLVISLVCFGILLNISRQSVIKK